MPSPLWKTSRSVPSSAAMLIEVRLIGTVSLIGWWNVTSPRPAAACCADQSSSWAVTSATYRRVIDSGVPSPRIRPSSSQIARPQNDAIAPRSWVTRISVLPASRNASMRS